MGSDETRASITTKRTVPCPVCNKTVVWEAANKWRPFCSERCRLIDLGEWLAEEKRIHGDPDEPQDSWSPEDRDA